MDTSFLDEPYYTVKPLAKMYRVSAATIRKWLDGNRFSKPGVITVYRLTDTDPVRVTQTGVDYFNSQIKVLQ